jgi:hypothetical protein
MGTWQNPDGLWIRLGQDEAEIALGGQYGDQTDLATIEFDLAWNDFNNTTAAVPRSSDSFGIAIPNGARIEEVETVVRTAFTVSAGTVAAGTLQMGLLQNDRSTVISNNNLLTSSATGTQLGLGTVGTKVVTRVGSTGAGAALGTTLSQQGIVCVANTTHGTNSYNAGLLRVRIRFFFP